MSPIAGSRSGQTSHVETVRGERQGWGIYVWLTIAVVPTAYLFTALVAACVQGIGNVGLAGDRGALVWLFVLMVTPAAVWVAFYRLMAGRFQRRACGALYATALAFPVTLGALVMRIAMGAPIY